MDDNFYKSIFGKFIEEFQKESDRGAAILAGSMLDQKLKDILKDFFITCKQTNELLEGFNAPIATFSSRLNLCFSLGLISEFEFEECMIVKKIRNDFAHKFELDFSFSNKKISELCQKFVAAVPGEKEDFKEKPRFLFVNATIFLYVNLMYREEYVKKRKLTRPDWHDITWNVRK